MESIVMMTTMEDTTRTIFVEPIKGQFAAIFRIFVCLTEGVAFVGQLLMVSVWY